MTEAGRPGGGPGPDTSPGPMMEALEVRQKARVGAVVGVVVAVLAYLLFVVVRGQPLRLAALYIVSLLVVASSTAVLVTVALVARTLLQATVDARKWIRRGGTAALGGGTLLAALALLGPALGRATGVTTAAGTGPLLAVYGWLLPACAVGLLAGVWALHAAHRPQAGYGWLGLAGWVVAAPAALFAWWVVAVEESVFLAGPLGGVSSVGLLAVLLALALGTSLLGAATLRSRSMPTRGPLLALFALPLALCGLTVALALDTTGAGLAAAYLDPPAPSTVALVTPVAAAWALLGLDLRAGRGVPPADTFGIELGGAGGSRPRTEEDAPDPDRSSGSTDD